MILITIKYYQNMKIDIDSVPIGAYALPRNTTYCVLIPWKLNERHFVGRCLEGCIHGIFSPLRYHGE